MSAGRIDVIVGPMFAGKTTELLRRIHRAELGHRKCIVFKYSGDTRYTEDKVCTHDKKMHVAIPSKSLMNHIDMCRSYDVIGIDEGQFFPDIVEFCETLANTGKQVIVAGLDGDFRRKPFGKLLELVPKCESVKKLTAICAKTGQEASFTKRTIENSEIEVIGGAEMYCPVSRSEFGSSGEIHLTLGPVESGKTTELMRVLNRHRIAGRKTVLISREKVESKVDVIVTTELPDIEELSEYQVIGVDDAHLFYGIAEWADQIANSGKFVDVVSLDGDENRNSFKSIIELFSRCERVHKLDAVCSITGLPAPFTLLRGLSLIPISRAALLQIRTSKTEI